MKKFFSIILCISFALTSFLGISVFAESEITVELDGKEIEFDINPEIIDGRTMVPLRKIFEEIGALVKWNGETRTVSARKNSKTISLTVDSAELNIDKGKTDDEGNPVIETISLEVPAQIVSGRTLVPARAISESFGLNVEWDEKAKKVIITSDDEDDDSWKENLGTINLSDMTSVGEGIEITDNQIKITKGGDYTLSGNLENGNITINTEQRVKLRLDGVKITSEKDPCIFVEKADKAFITICEDTENYFTAKDSEDGAIYSKENLEIKGNGALYIESLAGHGMKASDNLSIENGKITINATTDGIHINDTFKMSGGELNITAIGDGIDAESIINISGGRINIETNGTPIEPEKTEEPATQNPIRRPMWEETADVEFEKSTKGINAEWMMVISGGEFNINSASHAIHCQDEIEINGGRFVISSKYDKGISAHGNLTINGEETSIDVTKSTEGIESKNVMTINNGNIRVVSTDDAINATGGSRMMPGLNFAGNTNRENPTGAEKIPAGERVPGGNRKPQWQMTRPQWTENGEFKPPVALAEDGQIPPTTEDAPWWEFTGFSPTPPPGMTGPNAFHGGNMGGMVRNKKECLIINGGYLELCGNDDCVDANEYMVINGGTIMAANPTGSFSGNFGVLDADGQIIINENANIILASSSGNEKSLNLPQNSIIVYCEDKHAENDLITVSDMQGNQIYKYAPQGEFKAVLVTSSTIKIGDKYVITIGNETYEAEITQQSTLIGTPQSEGGRFGQWQGIR